MLKFTPLTDHQPGVIADLLLESFAGFMSDEIKRDIENFDKLAFDNHDTVGACAFITTFNDEVVGMASYDPRQGPEKVIIGYNCILPAFQGRGFGKEQVKRLLQIFIKRGFQKVVVTTGDHPYFIPAQKIYLACGFTEARRYQEGGDPRCDSIAYELDLTSTLQGLKTWLEPTPL